MALNFSDNFLQTLRYEDESAPTTPDIEKDTMSEAITKGILRGGQQLYEGAGSALQYLGNRIGNADLAEFGKEHAARGREVGEWFEPSRDIAKSYFGEDSTDRPGAKLAYDIANMGVSMAPALIAAGATMGSSLVPPAASRLVASIVGGAIGGMQEGTSTYQEMMKRGAPESDAARGLESMAAGAGILNAISMGKILSKSSGGVIGAIKKGLASGVTEATTEYLEEPLEVGIKKNLLKPEQFTEKEARDQLIGGFDVMPASFVLGALTGGIAGLSRSAPSPPSPTARDYARTPADEKAAYQEYFERPAADPASLVSGANNLYNNLIAKKASPDQQLTGDEQALISLLAQIKDDPREVAKYYGLRLPMRNETPADHGTIVEYLSRKQAEQEASKATAQAATQEAPPAPPPVDLESQGIPTGPVNITAPSNPLFGYPSDTEAAQLAAQNQAFNQGQAEMTGDIEAEKILRQQVPREIAREREAANIQGVDEGLNEMVGEAGNVEVPASATPGVLNQPETPETPETPKISETPVVKESLAPESAPADTTASIPIEDTAKQAKTETTKTPESPTIPFGVTRIKESDAPKYRDQLNKSISTAHSSLYDTDTLASSGFYDGTYSIPKTGGLIAAKKSSLYATSEEYRNKIDDAIAAVTETMKRANAHLRALDGKQDTGTFGVSYSIQPESQSEKRRGKFTVDVARAWNMEAKSKYPYTNYLGDVAIREALQNSLDAVLEAKEKKQIKEGKIGIEQNYTDFVVDDNGIGMSDVDIADKFLALHATGKDKSGRFGGFGIAKAVILGPHETATWTLHTRDNVFDNEMATNVDIIGTAPHRQGTRLAVKTSAHIFSDEAKQYAETTEIPKGITITYNGAEVLNPFKGLRGKKETVRLSDTTTMDITYYPKSPTGYNKKQIIRLVDPVTDSKLTQGIQNVWNDGFNGTLVIDVQTSETPGGNNYPLTDSRMELKGYDTRSSIEKIIEKHSVDPNSAKRAGLGYKWHYAADMASIKSKIPRIENSKSYMDLLSEIDKVFIETGNYYDLNNQIIYTPLSELRIRIDDGYKGPRTLTEWQAKHLAAYESTVRLYGAKLGLPVYEFYVLFSKPIDGGVVAGEYYGGNMGVNPMCFDKNAMSDPTQYALALRDLATHELTHNYIGKHNEEFTSRLASVQGSASTEFKNTLRIAEKATGKESGLTKKEVVTKLVPVEKVVEKTVEKIIELETKKYYTPAQQEFVFDNIERGGIGGKQEELYRPVDGSQQSLFESGEQTDQRGSNPSTAALGSKTGNLGTRGGNELANTQGNEQVGNVGVGTGGIRNASEVASTKPLPAAVQQTIAMYSRKPATRVSEVQLQETAKAVGAEVFVDRGAFGTDRVRVRIGNERKGFRDIRSAYDYLSSELNKSVSESKEQPVKSRTESALSIISTIYSKAKANPAGFTIDISDGSMVEKGYAVAPAKETATVFDNFTEQDARGFLRRFKPVFDSDDRAFFGGWMADDPKSPDYGKFVLDVSFVVDNFEDAAYIADIGEQDGIYHIDGPDPEARYIRTEDAIRTLKERGVYDEGKRAKLAGIRGRLHQIIKGEGVAERTASEPGAPAYSRAVLDNGRVSPQRPTSGQGTQGNLPAPVQVTGVHFSKEQRPVLSTSYAGTNYAGAEKTRLSTAPKEIQPRLYIYANVGYGINPEIGVGPHAHKLTVDNLHDFRAGGLDYEILPGENSNNAFEMAVLKAGYNGWFDRASGVICVLGKQKLIPEYLGVNREAYTNITQAPPMKITREMELNEILSNSEDVPQGYIPGPRWVDEIKENHPDIYPELEAMGIIEALRNHPDTLNRREIMAVKKIKPGRYSRSEEQPSQQLSRSDLQTLANDLLGTSRNRPGLIVVEKAADLPFDALEDAEGVFYDGKIYLVSSNIPTVEDAKRVIFHELVGHYGLRGFFGNRLDSTLDLIYNNNPLIRQYALDWMKNNRDLQLRYELSDLDYHYRAIEEAMAKMAQQNKPFSFAKRLLSAIQSLLRKVGLNKLADTLEAKSNAEALAILDKSRLYISKGAAIDSKMPSPAFAYFSRAPRKITPKAEKKPRKVLRDITDLEPPHATAPLPTIPPEQISDWMKDNSLYALSQFKQMLPKNTPELSILERLLASPEWYQHPIFRNLVDLFSNQRHDIANKIFQDNEMIDPTMPVSDKNSLIAAAKSLKNKGLSKTDIFRGKSSREYDALKWVITYGDAEYIRNKKEPLGIQMKKFEDHVREKLSKQRFTSAQINEIMNTWQLFRRSYDSYLKLMMAPMIEMRNKIKYASKSEGKENDLYKKLDTDLSYMINQMNSWSGFYAPRERLPGKWVVYGLKGEGDKEKRFREHVGTRFEAEKLKDRYERMGYTVQPITEYNQMPEIVMQNLRQTHITQAIKNAIQSEKAKSKGNQDKIDLLNQLNQGVLNQVADIIQARGYLSSKMARITEHHITGYIEDPIERYLIYARNTSNGLAKSQVSQTAYEVLRHIDPMKSADENRLYNAASKYIEDNLRNIDKADRAVALAKSAATMKYLALNPRSLLVNATAVATTAPAAIHQYATGGKIGLHKIVASLASAGADFGKFMAGNRNFSKEEQQFLNDLIRSHYDNPQYTMDVMGNLQGSGSKLWNTAMRWGMTPFSLSERWNRGTTMLAAFRLARSQGKSYEEASKLARIASDKAHGIYGKATLPEIAQGTTLVARAAQMMYSYAKFGHNYVQMLYDLGFRKQNLQAFAYALLSPVVLAGGASLPFKDNIVYTVNWILRFLGIKEDSEKWWWDQTRKYLGKEGEKLGRHGIIGYMGADISSSLSINLGIPDTYSKLAGPVGGVAEDLSNVKKYTQTGEYSKAAESVLPNAVTNLLRAYRERQEGVTSRQGRRLWDESGKPFIPTTGQALLRATGFRPSEQAMLQERKFESQRVYDTFKEAHDNILEAIRAYLISPVKNPEKMVRITRQIEKYNQQITSQGLINQVPLITRNSIMTQLRGVSAPKKKEAARLRSQTL